MREAVLQVQRDAEAHVAKVQSLPPDPHGGIRFLAIGRSASGQFDSAGPGALRLVALYATQPEEAGRDGGGQHSGGPE